VTSAKIKSNPDPDLQYRQQTVKANNKTLITPIKAIDHSKLDSSVEVSRKVGGLNEFYSGLTRQKIYNHLQNVDSSLDYSLNSFRRKIRNLDSEMQLCFFEYKDEGFPDSKEIGFMGDQAYVYSDITPIPMLSDFKDRVSNISIKKDSKGKDVKEYSPSESKFNRFIKYLSDVIETIEQKNNKPIMGYIPNYRLFFKELIEFYVKKGINTFYFDANGSSPMSNQTTLHNLLRELSAQETLETSFVHMLNHNYGKPYKDNLIIAAKDILGFGLGIDSLGEKHMQLKLSKELAEKMKKNPDNRSRLFIKNSYGYIKTSDAKTIKEFYPNDSGVDIEHFLSKTKAPYSIQNSFNMEQLALEAIQLKNRIGESTPILPYVEKKKNIKDEDLKILKKFKVKDKK